MASWAMRIPVSGDFVVDLVDGLAAPADSVGGAADVDAQRVADRLAHVEGFQQGQLLTMLFDQLGEADHHLLALGRGHARPHTGFEGGAGILDRHVSVSLVTAGHHAKQAAVDRADAFEGSARLGGAVLTVYERTGFDGQGLGTLFPVGTSQASHSGILSMGGSGVREGAHCQ